jgi:hypothetical protein
LSSSLSEPASLPDLTLDFAPLSDFGILAAPSFPQHASAGSSLVTHPMRGLHSPYDLVIRSWRKTYHVHVSINFKELLEVTYRFASPLESA